MVINPIVEVYIPFIRIPIKGGRSPIPNIATGLTMAHGGGLRLGGCRSGGFSLGVDFFGCKFLRRLTCWVDQQIRHIAEN